MSVRIGRPANFLGPHSSFPALGGFVRLGRRMLPAFARIVVLLAMASPPERSDAVHFDWVRHGRELRELSPKTVQKASPLKQLDYLAEQTADRLCLLGIDPNYDQAGRERAQRKFNDASI